MSVRFELPWGAWFGDKMRAFELPDRFELDVCRTRGAAELGQAEITAALENPIGAPTLFELARGRRDAVVAVEDITRPARLAEILPHVLGELRRGGLKRDRIRILIGSGGHAPLDLVLLRKKLGARICREYDVASHHPYENLVDLGVSRRGIPIHINRQFAEADLRIAVGSVVPHPYAGFGGGAKIVLPGVSGIETLEANHRPAVTGVKGGLNNVENNSARDEMEEIALKVGLEAIVNVVTDERRRTIGLFAGHPIAAHRAAVALARRAYATPRPRWTPDVVVLNAYPKDTEMLQVGNAFNVLRTAEPMPIRAAGVVVITAACSMGRGFHSLHGPGMRLYRTPVERSYLEGRKVIVHTPGVSVADARVSFWEGYPIERTWSGVLRRLEREVGPAARVAVFPTAPLQLLES